MEAILDIIFKAYSHSIISLEDFTATISRSIEGKKAETLKLSCRYFFIQSPNSCIVVVCVCVCMHPSMVLQPLLGPGLPQMMSPFLSCLPLVVCVCVCVCVNNFQIWLCEVLESYCLSLYKVCHIIIIPYIQYHMQWSWNKKEVEANA